MDEWEPNANSFDISRTFFNDSKAPTFVVTWDNAFGFGEEEHEDDANPDDYASATPEDGEQYFDTLDEAFEFCRKLLAACDSANAEAGI